MNKKIINTKEKYITKNPNQTRKIGERLALRLRSGQAKEIKSKKTAVVLGLQGDLGSGKTTFLQGFAKGLNIKERILSPTFVILKRFAIPIKKVKSQKSKVKNTNKNLKFTNFFHIDCYRLKRDKEILEINFKEIISNPKNIVAIEWPEKIKKILPKNMIKIKFKFIDKDKRDIFCIKINHRV